MENSLYKIHLFMHKKCEKNGKTWLKVEAPGISIDDNFSAHYDNRINEGNISQCIEKSENDKSRYFGKHLHQGNCY